MPGAHTGAARHHRAAALLVHATGHSCDGQPQAAVRAAARRLDRNRALSIDRLRLEALRQCRARILRPTTSSAVDLPWNQRVRREGRAQHARSKECRSRARNSTIRPTSTSQAGRLLHRGSPNYGNADPRTTPELRFYQRDLFSGGRSERPRAPDGRVYAREPRGALPIDPRVNAARHSPWNARARQRTGSANSIIFAMADVPAKAGGGPARRGEQAYGPVRNLHQDERLRPNEIRTARAGAHARRTS